MRLLTNFYSVIRRVLVVTLTTKNVNFIFDNTSTEVKSSYIHATNLSPFVGSWNEFIAVVKASNATATTHHIKTVLITYYTAGYTIPNKDLN